MTRFVDEAGHRDSMDGLEHCKPIDESTNRLIDRTTAKAEGRKRADEKTLLNASLNPTGIMEG